MGSNGGGVRATGSPTHYGIIASSTFGGGVKDRTFIVQVSIAPAPPRGRPACWARGIDDAALCMLWPVAVPPRGRHVVSILPPSPQPEFRSAAGTDQVIMVAVAIVSTGHKAWAFPALERWAVPPRWHGSVRDMGWRGGLLKRATQPFPVAVPPIDYAPQGQGTAPDCGTRSPQLDIVRRVVHQPLAVLVVAHRGLQVLVPQMRLHLLRLGPALDGQGATGVPEGRYDAGAGLALVCLQGSVYTFIGSGSFPGRLPRPRFYALAIRESPGDEPGETPGE